MSIRSVPAAWSAAWDFLSRLPDRQALRCAQFVWGVIALVVFIIVAVDPMGRSATEEYQKASTRWWGGQESLYKGKNNYLYLPQAAVIYTPFNVLPRRVGEPLWRMVCLGSLAFALWAAARMLAPDRTGAVFLVATVLVLPCALSSARNGQVNMPLAAIYLLTALALARERWHVAGILLAVSLALKPISIVPILLCGALYPRLILPLILWLGVMLASAYLHPDPKYVTWQYGVFWEKLVGSSANPTRNTWSDFAGMLRNIYLPLPSEPFQIGSHALKLDLIIRAFAAVVTFGFCLLTVIRTKDALRRALTVMLFAVMYLMLFNPRTETNSYVIFGIFVGLLGAYELLVSRNPIAAAGWILVALLLGTENYGRFIFKSTNLWLKPLVTLAVSLWLMVRVLRMPKGSSAIFSPPSYPAATTAG